MCTDNACEHCIDANRTGCTAGQCNPGGGETFCFCDRKFLACPVYFIECTDAERIASAALKAEMDAAAEAERAAKWAEVAEAEAVAAEEEAAEATARAEAKAKLRADAAASADATANSTISTPLTETDKAAAEAIASAAARAAAQASKRADAARTPALPTGSTLVAMRGTSGEVREGCIACEDTPTAWMTAQGYSCHGWRWAHSELCNRSAAWRVAGTCERSCSRAGSAYRAAPCCSPPPRQATPLGHSGEHAYDSTDRAVYARIADRFRGLERKLLALETFEVRGAS